MPNDLKLYTAATLDALSAEAAHLSRRRKNLNVHPVLADPIQRLFNALEPGTYARPHRHARDGVWELMVVVRGAFAVLRFDDEGRVLARADLRAGDGDCAVEIPAHAWHSVVSLVPGTIMFEIKPGPYSKKGISPRGRPPKAIHSRRVGSVGSRRQNRATLRLLRATCRDFIRSERFWRAAPS